MKIRLAKVWLEIVRLFLTDIVILDMLAML